MIDDSTERQVVRKSYELITAKNKWSEIESKLLATFIKELNPKSERDFKELNISIESIEKLWGVKINTTNLRNLCIELKRKVYEIPEYKVINEKIDYTKIKAYDYVSLFSDIKYHLEAKYISFEFDKKMHPHLIDFTRFVKYRIENILQFKSNYSISFYEYFKAEMFKKETIKTVVLELDYMHEWLNTPKSYKDLYSNFKNKVLTPVMEDLQKHTDIYFKFKEEKTGKKVTRIVFTVTQNVSMEEKAKLFDDLEFDSKYDKYKGKSCLYKEHIFQFIKLITPIGDMFKVEFANGDVLKFANLKDLEKVLLEE